MESILKSRWAMCKVPRKIILPLHPNFALSMYEAWHTTWSQRTRSRICSPTTSVRPSTWKACRPLVARSPARLIALTT